MKTLLLGFATSIAMTAAAATAADPSCGWASHEGCATCGGGCGPTALQAGHDSYYQNQRWPTQYMQPSRRAICQSMAVMVNNGWRRQTLMGSYHFDPKNPAELTEAGRRKAEWVLTQAPPDRRSVFVERTADPSATADRVRAVQDYAAQINVAAADVQESNLRNEGHPADMVDDMMTRFKQHTPPPVPSILPESTGGIGGSTTGG